MDTHAPSAPLNLTGTGTQTQPVFHLGWTDPPQGEGAPIVRADYRLCHGLNNPSPCAAASIFAAGQADQASDGTDLGADIVSINSVETTVRGGIRTP